MSEAQSGRAEAPVLFGTTGRLGHIELNRPRAINALTHEMVGLIRDQLAAWATDDTVRTVLLTGRGERGLCAGGDIVSLYQDAVSGDGDSSAAFWHDEYHLNNEIAEYPKPFVAIMDGIVLGGGIGLSAHSRIRVVTERSSIGMPETGIGFIPDVGGTWLLSHAPGELGTHLGLTAGSVGPGDALLVGLADHYVPSDRLPDLVAALADEDPGEAVARFAEPGPEAPLEDDRGWIDTAYAHDTAPEIVAALGDRPEEAARKAAERIGRKSPTSVALTLEALRRAATFGGLREALEQEYRVALRIFAGPDFREGVRAQVIDKDRNPSWTPQTLEEVGPEAVARAFAPLADRPELGLADSRTSSTPSPTTQE